MKYLLDINVLLAAIWVEHPHHSEANLWLKGKQIFICPLSELGFLRISTNKKVIGAAMAKARMALEKFLKETNAGRISDDMAALESHPQTSEQVTDLYLADLADRHGLKLGTLDTNISHKAVELIPA